MAARTRTIRYHAVSITVDETSTHWLVYVSPSRDLAAQGISPHRARLVRCDGSGHRWNLATLDWSGQRCQICKGRTALGMADYVRRLLRTYPKVTAKIPAPEVQRRETQWMPARLQVVA